MGRKIVVIGGGIIGLCSAYYLNKQGHEVVVIDQSNMDAGASYVNAGYLAPSHIIPLSSPGMMKKGLKWMLDASSPLYIKPRLDIDFLKWSWAFNRSCNPRHVASSIPVIKDIALLSQDLYDDIKSNESFRFHYEKKGLLMLCQTEKMLEQEIEVARLAQKEGLGVEILTAEDIDQLEPNTTIDAIGATYYTCDFHTTPHEFMEDIKANLKASGVELRPNEPVLDLVLKKNRIESVKTTEQVLVADEFVLAAGSWSGLLSKKLGLQLLMQAGKGYRINTPRQTGISVPAILAERKVAITPMNGFTRFAGTMEIAGINHDINPIRVAAIADGVKQYYPDIEVTQEEMASAACGLRPVSPDGLPYIGKSKKCENLTVAAGHAMMGWSMATATGKLVQEIVENGKTSMSIDKFSPDRKF